MASLGSGDEEGKAARAAAMVTSSGYWFGEGSANIQTHLANHFHTFEPNPSDQIYNLTTGMEMIGFPPTRNPHLSPPAESSWQENDNRFLSLCSSNPSQSFETRSQDDIFGKQISVLEDGVLGKASNLHYQSQFLIRNSKYLGPSQELLNEFCNIGTKKNHHHASKMGTHKISQLQHDESATSSLKNQSLYSLDLVELQRRKTKLIQMLDEVDRRYRHYCDQMRAVVSSFEGVAGNGAAEVYSALASRAMSRHFRCLRDGIAEQIKETRKAMGEKDISMPGATRGETPRLRVLEQTLRQQKAYQQINSLDIHPWRPQRGLPEKSVSILRAWLFEHFLHPYPSDMDKHILARQTGLSRSQVSNWFINARVRLWKPMVEEMYVEETKEEHQSVGNSDDDANRSASDRPPEDRKPAHEQLVRINSDSISSIVQNPDGEGVRHKRRQDDHQGFNLHHQQPHNFGAVELDFASYGGGSAGGGGGVSLTLGLQQHGGVACSPVVSHHQSSFFYGRDNNNVIEECQPVEYSIMENEGQINLPYRNLMGAQLLHDLAG